MKKNVLTILTFIMLFLIFSYSDMLYLDMNAERDFNQAFVILLLIEIILVFSIMLLVINEEKNKFKNLFNNMQEGVALHEIISDKDGETIDYKFIDVNPAFEDMTGLARKKIKGKTSKHVFNSSEEYWIKKYGKVASGGKQLRFVDYSEDLKKYLSINVYRHQKNQFVKIMTDVTDQILAENELKREKYLFQTTLQSLGDGVIATDNHGRIYIMNNAAEEITGWLKAETMGVSIEKVFRIYNEFTQEKCDFCIDTVTEGKSYSGACSILLRKDGLTLPVEYTAAVIKDDQKGTNGIVVVFRDYSEQKERQEEILYLSYHDQLTGLYNRRFFEAELSRLDTERNLPFTIAMIDVNGLKLTNDAFGHVVGDELLKKVAGILKKESRADDIVARIGGDEFVIILPKTTENDAKSIVQRIYKAASEERFNEVVISVSIGCDTKTSMDQPMNKVFVRAEENMYRKKLTESQSMRNQTIKVILNTLNQKNEREKIHSEKVSLISKRLAEAVGLDGESVKETETAGLMHDIGKIAITEATLNKEGKLDEKEIEEVRRHPESGYQILKTVDAYSTLAEYVLYHHERWDGKGYPRGLRGKNIPLISRIITIADVYEAMTAVRPYRKTITPEEALDEIVGNAGTQFDPEIVEVFEEHFYEIIENDC